MNKEKFIVYFKIKSQSKDQTDGIQITNVLTSVTENVTSAELAQAEGEIQKTYERKKKYQVEIPAKIKKEVGLYARDFDAASAIKKFSNKDPNCQTLVCSEKLKTLPWEQEWPEKSSTAHKHGNGNSYSK